MKKTKCIWVFLLGLSACAGGQGGAAPSAENSSTQVTELSGSFSVLETVAELETGNPSADSFTLRGTIPVPKGLLANSQDWLAVLDPDGTPIPAQIETVTRYPTGEAAVIEIIARMHKFPASPEARVRYEIVKLRYQSGSPPKSGPVLSMTPDMSSLIQGARDVLVLAKDCHANQYVFRVLAKLNNKVLKDGPYMHLSRSYGRLRPSPPVPGNLGTVDELLGVHAYIGVRSAEDVLTLDLRFHNGMVADKQESQPAIGKAYFSEILLLVPSGFTALQDIADPYFGKSQPYALYGQNYEAISIVAPLANGKMHVLGEMAQFHRRLAIARLGNEARAQAILDEEGLGFAREGLDANSGKALFSWWNPATANYLPQRDPLPSLDYLGAPSLRSQLLSDYNANKSVLLSGSSGNSYPWQTGALGWAHPYGVPYGGMTGGQEIHFADGLATAYAASVPGYLDHRLKHRANTDRQPDALYYRDGSPVSMAKLSKQSSKGYSYIPFTWFLTPQSAGAGFFQINASPTMHEIFVSKNALIPSYEGSLLGYLPHDLQHFIRYTGNAKVLAWLGNDAIAKDDLELQANLARLSRPETYSSANQAVSGLLKEMQFVTANPGVGTSFGRGEGWGIDANNAFFALADDAKRADLKPWMNMNVDAMSQGLVGCTGVLQAHVPSKYAYNMTGRQRQHFEDSINNFAMRGMLANVYEGTNEAREATIASAIDRNCRSFTHPVAWKTNAGPWKYLVTGPTNLSLPLYCSLPMPPNTQNDIDNYQMTMPLARGYAVSGDPDFIAKATEMFGGMGAMQAVLQATGGSKMNLENDYFLLYLMQQLGWVKP